MSNAADWATILSAFPGVKPRNVTHILDGYAIEVSGVTFWIQQFGDKWSCWIANYKLAWWPGPHDVGGRWDSLEMMLADFSGLLCNVAKAPGSTLDALAVDLGINPMAGEWLLERRQAASARERRQAEAAREKAASEQVGHAEVIAGWLSALRPTGGGVDEKRVHILKCDPGPFSDVLVGLKTFEIRSTADREFRVGDYLALRDFDGDYGGRMVLVRVRYMLAGPPYLPDAVAVLGIDPVCTFGGVTVPNFRRGISNRLGDWVEVERINQESRSSS